MKDDITKHRQLHAQAHKTLLSPQLRRRQINALQAELVRLKEQEKQDDFMIEGQGTDMGFMFERLDVYQKALRLTDRIFDASDGFPKGFYSLVDQLRRASTSILTNLAEGNGRWHKKDRKHFFQIARASAFECVPLIELCKMRGLVTVEVANAFKSGLEEIAKMITALIKGIETKRVAG